MSKVHILFCVCSSSFEQGDSIIRFGNQNYFVYRKRFFLSLIGTQNIINTAIKISQILEVSNKILYSTYFNERLKINLLRLHTINTMLCVFKQSFVSDIRLLIFVLYFLYSVAFMRFISVFFSPVIKKNVILLHILCRRTINPVNF